MKPSLLDNDLYKFTMMQAVWLAHPDAVVRYEFINRRVSDRFNEKAVELIREKVAALASVGFEEDELRFLGELPFMRGGFIAFLRGFQLKADQVDIVFEGGELSISIEGTWVETILWEVPLMAIISESYFEAVDTEWSHDLGAYFDRTYQKGLRLSEAGCNYIDFGTRRRRSYVVHDAAVRALSREELGCSGTSNVHFAMKYGMKPAGTMAHEWIMGFAGIYGVEHANCEALSVWRSVYGDALGVALTDTYTTELFFKNISGELAAQYAALRHDSECPFAFADKVLSFYEAEGIDPSTKGVLFSDSLSVDSAIAIEEHLAKRTNASFGIGTHFTNDFEESPALNMVVKLYSINGVNVVKISDNLGKASGHPDAIAAAMDVISEAI